MIFPYFLLFFFYISYHFILHSFYIFSPYYKVGWWVGGWVGGLVGYSRICPERVTSESCHHLIAVKVKRENQVIKFQVH